MTQDTVGSNAADSVRIAVYSSNATTRARVISALGRRPFADGPELDFVEVATEPTLIAHLDSGAIDLAILDGESSPAGGMGVAKQAKDELDRCPPILLLVARAADTWLADWSRADAVVSQPLDPLRFPAIVESLLETVTRGKASA